MASISSISAWLESWIRTFRKPWPRITSLIAARRSQGSSFRVSSSPRRRRADAHAGHEPGATRKLAAEAADKPASPVELEPDALGPGLRDWFGSLGHYPVKAAAFDTRLHGPAALTGRASKGVFRLLRAHGFDLVAEPQSFAVTKQDRLEPNETTRAHEWGAKLAASIASSAASGTHLQS